MVESLLCMGKARGSIPHLHFHYSLPYYKVHLSLPLRPIVQNPPPSGIDGKHSYQKLKVRKQPLKRRKPHYMNFEKFDENNDFCNGMCNMGENAKNK